MPIDIRRIVLAAVEAALEDNPAPTPAKKSRLSGGRALILGAGLMTAGRLVAGERGRGMIQSLRQQLDDNRSDDDEQYVDAEPEEEFDDEEAFEDDDYPEGEGDEDFDEPDDEEEPPDEEFDDEEEPAQPARRPRRSRTAASRKSKSRGRARA